MTLTRRSYSAAVVALIALAVAACGGSSHKSGSQALEKTDLKVGLLPTPDAATIYLANEKGYFKEQGLTVTPTFLGNGADTVGRVMSGSVDFADSGYVPIIQAAAQGLKVRVVTDGYQGRSGLYPIIALPGSSVRDTQQLAGKKIGIINTKGFPALLTAAALKSNNVSPQSVKYVEIQLPNMAAALQSHSIDAAFMSDPYLTQAEQKLGARVVVDTMSGPTANLAVSGYFSSQRFVQENPKTVAAFQRAMAKAQAAAADRTEVTKVLPQYIKGLSPQTQQTITLGTYPLTMNKTRIQRVADLMMEYGALKQRFDVQKILQ